MIKTKRKNAKKDANCIPGSLFIFESRLSVFDLIADPLYVNKIYKTKSELSDR